MSAIDLKYGSDVISLEYDERPLKPLGNKIERPALTDVEIGTRLDRPIDSPPIEEIVGPGESVLIVVPDATRRTGCGQLVNLIVRRLIANGSAPHEIRIIFATGIHRKVTETEKSAILTPFIAQRIKTLDHGPRDLMQLARVGKSFGIPVELNRALLEHDHVILVGGVTFHYFAGFTGGRKLVCPGLASARTIAETHKLAFDCGIRSRRDGVGTGLLEGNAVHEAFVEAAAMIRPAFGVMSIVNSGGDVSGIFCGDWRTSHEAACSAYSDDFAVTIEEKRDLVLVSCGGFPHDINLIQAHKALEAASKACAEGGSIILLAECREGTGRDDFLKWFDEPNSEALAARLCEKYQVNGQTAWSLFGKAERFRIKIVTDLPEAATTKMRLEKIDAAEAIKTVKGREGYLIADGARLDIKLN